MVPGTSGLICGCDGGAFTGGSLVVSTSGSADCAASAGSTLTDIGAGTIGGVDTGGGDAGGFTGAGARKGIAASRWMGVYSVVSAGAGGAGAAAVSSGDGVRKHCACARFAGVVLEAGMCVGRPCKPLGRVSAHVTRANCDAPEV